MSVLGTIASLPETAVHLITSHGSKSRAQANNVSGNTAAKPAATGSTSSDGGLTGTSVGTTFLNLLIKELQNQDPTAPMDSTAMTGQMISLNQLDQLIAINQTLSAGSATSSSSGTSSGSGSTAGSGSGSGSGTSGASAGFVAGATRLGSADEVAARSSLLGRGQDHLSGTMPLDPTSAIFNSATLNAAAASASSAGAINLSNFNSMFGGK